MMVLFSYSQLHKLCQPCMGQHLHAKPEKMYRQQKHKFRKEWTYKDNYVDRTKY